MSEKFDPEEIGRLLADLQAGEISPQEAEQLKRWGASSQHRGGLYERLSQPEGVREASEQLLVFDAQKGWAEVLRKQQKRRWARFRAAFAGVGVAAAAIVMFFVWAPDSAPQQLELPIKTSSASSSVRLFSSTGRVEVIDSMRRIDLAGAVVEGDQSGVKISARAASSSPIIAYNTVDVPSQKRFEITLADGTRVVLNARSSLRFPEQFSKSGQREVYLRGEAYFVVAQDSKCPFIVHTGAGNVRVTGTQFNLSCYENSPTHTATLVEGSVLFGAANGGTSVALSPGMQSSIDLDTDIITTRLVDTNEFTSWREGVFAFKERSLKEIFETLGRWYGCRVLFEDSSRAQIRFTGKVSLDSSLDQVVGFFRTTEEFDVRIERGTLVIR